MDIELEKLVVLNLKYSNHERTLNRYVFADFALKALYQIINQRSASTKKKPVHMTELYGMISKLTGLKVPPRRIILESLILLENDKKVIGNKVGGFTLPSSILKDIKEKLQAEDVFIREVLKYYFPADIKESTLRKWFYEVSALLFGKFGDELVANISGDGVKRSNPTNLTKIINSSLKRYRLEVRQQTLLAGYEGFINSNRLDDQKLINDFAIKWFGARLVAANVGRDPITIDEIKKSKFILDTNVLIEITLKRRHFSQSISALGKALKEINAELIYLPNTRDQYINVINYEHDQIMKLIKSYSIDKIKELGLEEDFITACIAAGCKDADDVDKFFINIRDIPNKLENGPDIKLEEDEKILATIEKAGKDKPLLSLLKNAKNEVYIKRDIKKEVSDSKVWHEASLIRVAEFLEQDEGRRVWALTLDNGLRHAAVQSSGSAVPKVMGVDTLIEFLALTGVSSGIDNAHFAPLLANILKNRCLPYGGTHIRMKDLINLQASINDAPNYPVANIRRMVKAVTRARIEDRAIESIEVQAELAGLRNTEDDHIDEQLKTTKESANLEKKMREKIEKKLENAQAKINMAEEEGRIERKKRDKLKKDAVSYHTAKIRMKLIGRLLVSLLWRLAVVVGIVITVTLYSKTFFDENMTGIELFVALVAIVSFIVWVFSPYKAFHERMKNSKSDARKQVESNLIA